MAFTLTIRGGDAMARRLRAIARQTSDQIAIALRFEAELIMTKSKQSFVPVNDGILKGSGHVKPPVRKGKEVSVTMAYGGAAAAYAEAIHEHPSSASPPTWENKPIESIKSVRTGQSWSINGRGPKYLERPLRNAIPGMPDRIAQTIRARL